MYIPLCTLTPPCCSVSSQLDHWWDPKFFVHAPLCPRPASPAGCANCAACCHSRRINRRLGLHCDPPYKSVRKNQESFHNESVKAAGWRKAQKGWEPAPACSMEGVESPQNLEPENGCRSLQLDANHDIHADGIGFAFSKPGAG